jgi:hypothetical protein
MKKLGQTRRREDLVKAVEHLRIEWEKEWLLREVVEGDRRPQSGKQPK